MDVSNYKWRGNVKWEAYIGRLDMPMKSGILKIALLDNIEDIN